MNKIVKVAKIEDKVLVDYWVMQAVNVSYDEHGNEVKKVIAEKRKYTFPDSQNIAQFLADSNADFVTTERRFCIEEPLPFN